MSQKGNITVDDCNALLTSTVIMGSSYLGSRGPGTSWLQNCLRVRLSLCPGCGIQHAERSMLVLELQTLPRYHCMSLHAAYGGCEDLEIPQM